MTEFCPAPFCCACTTRSHIREEARAYGPFCHKEQVHDLLRQKISKQIERYSIYSAYCAAFVKVKYTDVEKEDTEKQKVWKISKEQKKFWSCVYIFFFPHMAKWAFAYMFPALLLSWSLPTELNWEHFWVDTEPHPFWLILFQPEMQLTHPGFPNIQEEYPCQSFFKLPWCFGLDDL